MSTASVIIGRRIGRLVVVDRAPSRNGKTRFVVRCDCGTEKEVWGTRLAGSDNTQSCGCYRREAAARHMAAVARANVTHGQAGNDAETPTYISWRAMVQRCGNPKDSNFKHYGSRGISVCQRWRSFEHFFADMGERPDSMTLDRIDVNGNYEPGNCRWATAAQQTANRRKAV